MVLVPWGPREVLCTHLSCRVHRCAQGDTHRPRSLGGTSLQGHNGMAGSSWHQISPEGSLETEGQGSRQRSKGRENYSLCSLAQG